MGTFKHNIIVVHGERDRVYDLWRLASTLFNSPGDGYFLVTPMIVTMNAIASFMVGPDGSKEESSDSDEYDKFREEFKRTIDLLGFPDGSNMAYYTEIVTIDDQSSEGPRIISTNIKKGGA